MGVLLCRQLRNPLIGGELVVESSFQIMSAADPPANGEGSRPGILIRPPDPSQPFRDTDLDLLESRLETKIGEGQVKKIELSDDKMEAYVELEDAAGTVSQQDQTCHINDSSFIQLSPKHCLVDSILAEPNPL